MRARLDPGRFCAVGGHSAALDPGARGAFGVIAAAKAYPKLYGHAQPWPDVGAQDPSCVVADEQFASALHIHLRLWPGAHDFGYWNAH